MFTQLVVAVVIVLVGVVKAVATIQGTVLSGNELAAVFLVLDYGGAVGPLGLFTLGGYFCHYAWCESGTLASLSGGGSLRLYCCS